MGTSEAVSIFALGTLFGCFMAAIAINNFALRTLKQATKELRTARMLYRAAARMVEVNDG